MSTPLTPGTGDTGGQQPTSEPRGGQTSAEAAGSIRDRLRSPGPQSSGGDTRGSELTGADFQNTDSRQQLRDSGRDEGQHSEHHAPEPAELDQPRGNEPLDPAQARRSERKVASLFLLSVLGVVGFFGVFWFWPFTFGVEEGNPYYTPLLGLTMMIALFGIGAGAVVWAKELMVDEEAVQERHPFGSPADERTATVAAIQQGFQDSGLPRRKLLRNSLLLGAGSLAALPVPLLFTLGPYAHKERALEKTAWKKGVRLIRQNGTPVKMGDLQIGAVESVFPDVPRGTKIADSPALLIRMRPEVLTPLPGRDDWAVDGHIVYSSVCTHLGCPVKLYEQQTHNLLCPCHQSTFDAAEGALVKFGPASRPLPQLAISVDQDGYFIAQGDFNEPVGPSYWERKP
ncbi:MAG: Rieske (2Fe-2S) iron-sulfur domain protein [Frankiales bacterium]|jgi:ubiquinol-cytochrome c reductase iron-sulfur subunit|nr:Rieske (2Fe-2S) iron-sulfur domain protein [Frankiales bacterium]